jgi:hypothetical protein
MRPGKHPLGLDRFAHPAASPEATLKEWNEKRGSAIHTLPVQAFCGAKRRKKRALVRMGEWYSARLAPALTVGEFNWFVAAM